jgi:branched-chain amino acid transport system substrate-binding protein
MKVGVTRNLAKNRKEATMKRGVSCNGKIGMLVWVVFFLIVLFGMNLQANAAEALKIGVLVPLTGPVAEGGTRMLKAIELATDEMNQAGGVLGRKIELKVWDTEGKVEKGVTGAKKLIMQDDVWGLIGTYRSGVTLAVQDVAFENKKILMVTDAASNEITRRVKENYNKYKYTFRSAASIDQFAELMVPFLTEVVKAKSYFYVSETTLWTKELGDVVKKFADIHGIKFLGSVECDPAATEFTSEIAKIKNVKPDAVLCSLAGAAAVPFAKQYYENKVGKPIVYGLGMITFKNVIMEMGEKANYQSTMAFCWDLPVTNKTLEFYKKYTKLYSAPGGYEDVRSYDGMYILMDGIKRAGSLDVEKVIKTLEKTDYTGVAGRYVFGEDHQCKLGKGLLEGVIIEWVNGKDHVLYPPSVAKSKYIPAPWQ